MDHKHREDLDQNDLLEFSFRAREWFTKYGSMLLWVLLAVAAIALAVRWYSISKTRTRLDAWNEVASAADPDSFRAIAREYEIAEVKALAYLRGADVELARVSIPQPPQSPNTTQPATRPAGNIEEAKQMYLEVTKLQGISPVYKLNAMLGLAAVAEAERDWTAAEQWYTSVENQAGEYTSIKSQAEARASRLESLKTTPAFAAEISPPTTQAATEPTTQSTSSAQTQPHSANDQSK